MSNVNSTYSKQQDFWFPLDNAAKIYPAIRSNELTTVFRISAVLKERINIRNLLVAIKAVENRFPYFKVRLRKGFFWYYLEYANYPLKPEADTRKLCRAFSKKDKNKHLFRILANKNTLSVEFSHILSDGTGAYNFIRSLLTAYFEAKGTVINSKNEYRPGSPILEEEYEDAYKRYFKENIPSVYKLPRAFHLTYLLNKKPRFKVLTALMHLEAIKLKAREKNVSITDYLVAVYLFVLQEIYHSLPVYSRLRKRKILRIQVPINLRAIYPSKTMRNFSLFVMPEIDLRLGHYSFDEIVKIVYHKMQLETDEKLVNKIISRNVGSERNFFVRGIPLILKSLILYFKYYSEGSNQYSGVITNLGKVDLQAEIMEHIQYFVVMPPPPNKKLKVNCGVVGCGKLLTMSFGNICRSNELEKRFIRFLTEQGIKIKLTK